MLLHPISSKKADINWEFILILVLIAITLLIMIFTFQSARRGIEESGAPALEAGEEAPDVLKSALGKNGEGLGLVECDATKACDIEEFCNINNECEPKREVGDPCGVPHEGERGGKDDTCLSGRCGDQDICIEV